MKRITRNTYPNQDRNPIGTLCEWAVDLKGNLSLKKCNNEGQFVDGYGCAVEALFAETIIFKGQIYRRDGGLLEGKKEPRRIGLVAEFKKKGWKLELEDAK